MSARDAEAMTNAMLLDSPLPNLERGNDEIPAGDGSSKLPEGGEGEKLPVGVYCQPCSGIPLAVGFVGRDRLL